MNSHHKVISDKMKPRQSGRYHECRPSELGQVSMMDPMYAAVALNVPQQAATPDVLSAWVPMEFHKASEDKKDMLLSDPNFAMQQKMDGTRLRLSWDEATGTFEAASKSRRIIEPDLQLKAQFIRLYNAVGDICLDGEWADGQFHIFDCLKSEATDLATPFAQRILAVSKMSAHFGTHMKMAPTAFRQDNKQALYDAVLKTGGEGVIFKRRDREYVEGRSHIDLKFKFKGDPVTCYVNSIALNTDGTPRQSLNISLITRNGLLPAGKVTCNNIAVLQDIKRRIGNQMTVFCDVEYLYWTGSAFHQPTFVKLRNDQTIDTALTLTVKARNNPELEI